MILLLIIIVVAAYACHRLSKWAEDDTTKDRLDDNPDWYIGF